MTTPTLDQVLSGGALAPGINNNGEAARPAYLFGRRASATVLLTRGYYGGVGMIGSTPTTVPHGTVTLTPTATNYMEADPATLAVSVNTTGFTGGRIPIAKIVTDGAGIVSDDSVLAFAFAAAAAGSYSLPAATTTTLGGFKLGAGLAINSTTGVLSVTAATSAALTGAVNVFTKNQSVTPVTIAISSSIAATDASLSNSFKIIATTNFTLSNPTNLTDGMVLNYKIKQDATGSRIITFGSKFKFAGGTAPTLSTVANSRDFLSAWYDATDDVLYCSLLKGVA